MNCETAESDPPLAQAERTGDGEEPPLLLHVKVRCFNAACESALSARTRITAEIGPQSGAIPSYSYIEPCTAALWDEHGPAGSTVFATRWNIGQLPGVTQPVTLVGSPFYIYEDSLLARGG